MGQSQDWVVPEIVRLSLISANAPRHFFLLCYMPSKSVLVYVTLILFVIIIIIIIIINNNNNFYFSKTH